VKITLLAAAGATLLALGGAAPAASRSSACGGALRAKHILDRSRHAVLFTDRRRELLHACWLPTGRVTLLSDQLEGWAGPPALDLRGSWAAIYTSDVEDIEVYDVRRGKLRYGADGHAGQVGVVVVSVRGNVAWTACRLAEGSPDMHDDCDRADRRPVEVYTRIRGSSAGDSKGVRLVTSKHWLDPSSLKLRHGKLTWRVKGRLHGIRFR
jgi:hypothetical protein